MDRHLFSVLEMNLVCVNRWKQYFGYVLNKEKFMFMV